MANKSRIWVAVAAAIVLILVSVGIYFWNTKKSDNQAGNSQTGNTQNNNTLQNTEEIKFDLYKESGNVSYKGENDSSYTELKEDQLSLKNKSFVKTGADTDAHIIFNDNSMISLDQNSEIQIVYDGQNRDIIQSAGNSWHRLQKLTQGNTYQVETSNTLATVRGTIFGVKVEDNKESSVYVLEHQVEVNQETTENGKKVIKDTQMVPEGKHMGIPDFENGKKMDLADISEDKKNTDWFEKNRLLDQEYKIESAKEMMSKMKNDTDLKDKIKKIKEKYSPNNKNFNLSVDNLKNPALLGTLLAPNANCSQLVGQSDDKFNQGIAEMEKSGQSPSKTIDFLKNYFAKLKEFCSDGKLSPTEIAQISLLAQDFSKNIVSDIPNIPNLPSNLDKNKLLNPPKTDLSSTGAKVFESYLKSKYDLSQNPDICKQISSDNISADLESISQYQNYFGQEYNQLVSYLKLLQTSCQDGSLSQSEIDSLNRFQSITSNDALNQQTSGNSNYETEIQAKFDKYAKLDGESVALCQLYSRTSVTNIINDFVATEKAYQMPAKIAVIVRPLIVTINSSCQDGSIDADETDQILKLIPANF
jgi:hypothetical protein